jgi:hypothetical protein
MNSFENVKNFIVGMQIQDLQLLNFKFENFTRIFQ